MVRDEDEEIIHVRCSQRLKEKIGHAAVATDRNLSEYVRDELGEAAERDLEGIIVDELRTDA